MAAGARRTMGADSRLAGLYDHVYRVPPGQRHVYDVAAVIARALGLDCEARPWMTVSDAEQARARVGLQQLADKPFDIGVFVGGHLNKRLPLYFWLALCDALNDRGLRFLLLIGPEEAAMRPDLEARSGGHGCLASTMPLRDFAATLTQLPRLITPDTGPMHMAAALGVPVTAVLNTSISRKFTPRGRADQVLLSPSPAEIVAALDYATLCLSASHHIAFTHTRHDAAELSRKAVLPFNPAT